MAKSKYPLSPRALAAEGAGISFEEMTWDNPAIGQVYSFLYRNFPTATPKGKRWEVNKEMRDAYMTWLSNHAESVEVAA